MIILVVYSGYRRAREKKKNEKLVLGNAQVYSYNIGVATHTSAVPGSVFYTIFLSNISGGKHTDTTTESEIPGDPHKMQGDGPRRSRNRIRAGSASRGAAT